MIARKRRRWVIALGVTGVLALAAWWALNPRAHDPYPFLAAHPIADVAVLGPGSWGPKEMRTYSWKQPWHSVAEQARRELPAFGLKERPKDKRAPEGYLWMGKVIDSGLCGIGTDTLVSIEPGRSFPIRRREPHTDGDPEWVTVLVETDLEDNWVNIVRYTCFPMPE